jgi:hypothetical protein
MMAITTNSSIKVKACRFFADRQEQPFFMERASASNELSRQKARMA